MTPEETDEFRRLGKESPFRDRPVEENLDLLARMKAGEFPDGARTLRAKIDMQSPNMWLRDPVLYRIRHAEHHHTGSDWCIYPMYDFAHCISDYIEGITHSLCTLEFEVHRPLYDWILESLNLPRALAAPDRVRAAEHRLHGHEQAQAAPARERRRWSAAGTIRACRRSPACGGAGSPRARSAISSCSSASRNIRA